ncbi:MAG: GTP-binding protein [Clostridia bacterium]|nr:GTP-binding protein [Clostridia bacterium]
MEKQIDLYLLTGFLGAGKTTVLKEILKLSENRKIGVIMNEFGKTGIDGGLVSDRSAELIEINRGSIFCDCLKLSFIESLKDMADKPLDAIFVEGSGLADPSNIGDLLEMTATLVGERYNYRGSICVVDAPNFLEQSQDIEAMNRQIKFSHLAVISKNDLVDEETIHAVAERIQDHNSDIQIVQGAFGRLPFNLFDQDLRKGKAIQSDDTTNKKDNKPKTLTLSVFEPVREEALEAFLKQLSPSAYRMKGHLNVIGKGMIQVDVVNQRIDYKAAPEDKETQLVILSKIGPQIIRPIVDLWETHVNASYKLRN